MENEKDMTLIGFLLFKDPVKATSNNALKKFVELGINLKVLSGDSLVVTENIAKEAGISFEKDEIINGDELENMSDSELVEICKRVKIFARLTPEQKYKIVHALILKVILLDF